MIHQKTGKKIAGESVQAARKEQMRTYYERISREDRQASRQEGGAVLEEACPFCSKKVRMWSWGSYGQSGVIRCETSGCLHMEIRGL